MTNLILKEFPKILQLKKAECPIMLAQSSITFAGKATGHEALYLTLLA